MNKKAEVTIIYGLIIGLIIFLLVALAFGNGVKKAFKSYSATQKSSEKLYNDLLEVSSPDSNVKMKLVFLNLDEDAAIYIFNKNQEAIIEYYSKEGHPEWNGNSYNLDGRTSTYGSNIIITDQAIARPGECLIDKTCFCTCKDVSYEEPSATTKQKIIDAYFSDEPYREGIYDLKCEKGINCKNIDVDFVNGIDLKKITSDSMYKRIQNQDAATFKDSYIFRWENGFSIWRLEEPPRNYFYSSKYLDAYVIKMTNGKLGMCFDPECMNYFDDKTPIINPPQPECTGEKVIVNGVVECVISPHQ